MEKALIQKHPRINVCHQTYDLTEHHEKSLKTKKKTLMYFGMFEVGNDKLKFLLKSV